MNRRELILAITEDSGLDRKTVDAVLDSYVYVVTATVAQGEKLSIPGFAKFARVDRPARIGRNPATGEPVKIKASRKARITPLKAFKDAVLTGKVPKRVKPKAVVAKPVAKKAPATKATTKKAPAKKSAKPVAKKATASKAAAKRR